MQILYILIWKNQKTYTSSYSLSQRRWGVHSYPRGGGRYPASSKEGERYPPIPRSKGGILTTQGGEGCISPTPGGRGVPIMKYLVWCTKYLDHCRNFLKPTNKNHYPTTNKSWQAMFSIFVSIYLIVPTITAPRMEITGPRIVKRA